MTIREKLRLMETIKRKNDNHVKEWIRRKKTVPCLSTKTHEPSAHSAFGRRPHLMRCLNYTTRTTNSQGIGGISMKLYTDISDLERALETFEQIQAVVDLLTEKTGDLDNDLSDQYTRHQLVSALFAVSAMIEQASTETSAAIARAYMSPHDFSGQSFKA